MNFQSFDFKCLFIFLSFVSAAKFEDEISCENLSTIETHPLECCIYPQFIDDLSEVTYKCSTLCKALPSPPFYCLKNCKISESGVIARGKFNGSKVINLFYEGGYKDPTNLTEKWTKVVKKSLKTCDKEVQTESDITSEDYNFFYTKFIECVRMENFLNCPDYSKASNCQKINKIMSKCDESNYPMLHEYFFEEFYYKNNNNVTLKWTTRTTTLGTPYPTEETTETTTETTLETSTQTTSETTTNRTTEMTSETTTKVATKEATEKTIKETTENPTEETTTEDISTTKEFTTKELSTPESVVTTESKSSPSSYTKTNSLNKTTTKKVTQIPTKPITVAAIRANVTSKIG
ncbi:unnamed protein product [Chironomus riparius]|uniref:Uncharacterized protein n=1 Tax=Chironomus riparius TaxID=315576 RepID=A0A9N9S3Q7_9DIPT|nr:unnamed protein product [Chironomus riparius]